LLVPRIAESVHEGASLAAGMLSAHCLDEPAETRAARITTLLAIFSAAMRAPARY
jgi:hypothetical protein